MICGGRADSSSLETLQYMNVLTLALFDSDFHAVVSTRNKSVASERTICMATFRLHARHPLAEAPSGDMRMSRTNVGSCVANLMQIPR